MNNYMKTIVSGLLSYINKFRGNWNQNDPSAPDYIRNRTHYEEVITKIFLPETNFDYSNDYFWEWEWDSFTYIYPINENVEYKIIFDNIEYKCIAVKGLNGYSYIGNQSLENQKFNEIIESNEPFLIYEYGVKAQPGKHTITITYLNNEVEEVIFNKEIFIAPIIRKESKILSNPLSLDYIYEIKYNEEIYKCFPIVYGNWFYLGDPSFSSRPFYIECSDINDYIIATLDPECTFSINGSCTKVHKIDKKYLPEIRTIYNLVDGKAESSVRTIGTNSNIGNYAFAEGYQTKASGRYSHAEGYQTTASNYYSHAEGYETTASGECSHAEGNWTTASGVYSHAEGYDTIASGDYSHVEGGGTTASGDFSHVQGRFNIEDAENKYAHIVGNGKYSYDGSLNSNAHTLDWEGNAWFQGNIYLGGTGQENYATKVVTEKFISQPKDYISFKDIENNFIYILQMKNGNLVSRRTISRIEITKMPNKLNYTEGEIFNPEGMKVVGYCEDGNIIIINNYIYPKTPISSNIITISYEEAGKTYTENINISISPFNPEEVLVDFYYTTNEDGTYTITDWKGTYNGVSSTKIIVPDNGLIKI